MRKRIHHKAAWRKVDQFNESKGYHWVPLCIMYGKNTKAKKPILEKSWTNVNCKCCQSGKFNGVPDGMGIKGLVTDDH